MPSKRESCLLVIIHLSLDACIYMKVKQKLINSLRYLNNEDKLHTMPIQYTVRVLRYSTTANFTSDAKHRY